MPQDFKQLVVWKESFDFAKDIYKISANFPKEEIYGVTSQLRRAAISISSNIAEGCGRRTNKDFASFLYNALGSCKECVNLLLLSKEFDYVNISDHDRVSNQLEKISKQLSSLIRCVHEKNTNYKLPTTNHKPR